MSWTKTRTNNTAERRGRKNWMSGSGVGAGCEKNAVEWSMGLAEWWAGVTEGGVSGEQKLPPLLLYSHARPLEYIHWFGMFLLFFKFSGFYQSFCHLSPVSTTQKCTRVDGPSTRVHFLTPVNSGRQLACQKMHPSSRAVNSAREFGPWTQVVETGLYYLHGRLSVTLYCVWLLLMQRQTKQQRMCLTTYLAARIERTLHAMLSVSSTDSNFFSTCQAQSRIISKRLPSVL